MKWIDVRGILGAVILSGGLIALALIVRLSQDLAERRAKRNSNSKEPKKEGAVEGTVSRIAFDFLSKLIGGFLR